MLIWALIGFTFYLLMSNRKYDLSTSSKPQKTITFDDIMGLEDCKQSLREIIEYMRDPAKYQ
jgi:ATP-dependent Zn protease